MSGQWFRKRLTKRFFFFFDENDDAILRVYECVSECVHDGMTFRNDIFRLVMIIMIDKLNSITTQTDQDQDQREREKEGNGHNGLVAILPKLNGMEEDIGFSISLSLSRTSQ